MGYTEEDYGLGLKDLVRALKKGAPKAQLIWATITPVRTSRDLNILDSKTERVQARNRIAAQIMSKEGISTDDLFASVADHPDYYRADGIHSNEEGEKAEANRVAAAIARLLP